MLNNTTPEQAARHLSAKLLTEGYALQALHTYTDEKNNILYWRIRLKNSASQKWIRPMYKDDNNEYRLGEPSILNNQAKPLYGLHLLAQKPKAMVLIVEGEHPTDVMNQYLSERSEDYAPCTITSGSATSADKAYWEPLANRDCLIWPDNDEVGIRYAEQVRTKLEALGCLVEILDAASLNLSEGGDCVDWLEANPAATVADILSLPRVNKTETQVSNNTELTESEKKIIAELSTLSPLEYDRKRETSSKTLRIRTATLDTLVKANRATNQKENKTPFTEIEPWPEPINPAELLTEISDTIKRFIICPPETVYAATLWIAMTWFIDVVQVAPLAVITAPEKRCGKSQLLFLLGRLVNRPISASNITPAALFRSIDAWQPTLLIDEADAFMRENEELRGIINCGHTRDSAKIIRVVGDDYTPTTFTVWGAKALAGIGHLPDTIMDRSITLELRRKLANEKTERLRHAEPNLFKKITSKLARFALDYSDKVQHAKPELPDELNDRAQDNWEPLLAIADIAQGEWPRLARTIALKISGDNEQSPSVGVELLADIQEIFESKNIDRISSAMLIESLCADDEKSWATYNRGSSITPRQVAKRLREFGIISNTVRFGTMLTAKGYLKHNFDDAFARYLGDKRNNVTSE
jgi:putative DNA primase/helicase